MRAKVIRGSAWTVIGFGTSQVLRLGSNLVLTRLLLPEAFGLVTLAGVFLQGLAMFSDVGTGPALIQNERGDDPDFQDTAWTIQVIRGAFLTLAACALAIPAAELYDEPVLIRLLPVMGLTAFIAGFNPTKHFTVRRQLSVGRLTLIELLTQAITIVCVVAIAWTIRSVWALAAGGVIGGISSLILQRKYLEGRLNKFRWDVSAVNELMTFGRWIFLATAISFIGQQFDRLFLAKVMGTRELGVYSIGLIFSGAVVACNMQLIRRIGLATLTQTFRDLPAELSRRYYRIRRINDLVFMLGLGALTVLAPYIIELLYDERYWGAGNVLQMLSIAAVIPCVLEPAESCVVAMGKPRWATVRYALRTFVCLFGIPFGWYCAGMHGLLCAIVVCEVPGMLVLWSVLRNSRVLRLRRELVAFAMYGSSVAAVSFGIDAVKNVGRMFLLPG